MKKLKCFRIQTNKHLSHENPDVKTLDKTKKSGEQAYLKTAKGKRKNWRKL